MNLKFRQQLPNGREIIDADNENVVVGTIYYTYHPTLLFEVFSRVNPARSKRVSSNEEALSFILEVCEEENTIDKN